MVAALVWIGALVVAPMAIASSRPILSFGAAAIYVGGARICHQRPERCFWIHGRPMPVCARCTGLYAGAAVAGPVALLLASGLSSRRARILAALAALPTVATWSLEMAGLWHPSNVVRFIAGLPLGFAAAWLVLASLRRGGGGDPDVGTVGP
jgi:uncharacterized membrane protein